MPRITLELLRKRAEHNEGVVATLEEISLHQEEIEKIELIGTLCKKLRILYLQNNIIERIEDLSHMKDLRYLNLALNNVKRIEGLRNCEFLEKLDLTVNFIDVDELAESINHLKPLEHLRELYMLGNPAQSDWPGFAAYVTASLPRLQMLDGKEITKSDRIKALQQLPMLRAELAHLVAAKKARTLADMDVIEVVSGGVTDVSSNQVTHVEHDEKVPYTPETRRSMYMELAEQKEEEETRKRANQPRDRDPEAEHAAALEKARRLDQNGVARQCNEGKWKFHLDDETKPGYVVLEVFVPKYLDSSLIHVDVHPMHVSITIKNKLLRLRFPEEVKCDQGTALRSKTTGALQLTVEKVDPRSVQRALRAKAHREEAGCDKNDEADAPTPKTLQAELLRSAVQIRGLVARPEAAEEAAARKIHAQSSRSLSAATKDVDAPPLLF
ncbi:hypothetical protein SPRG_07667 [Saprolegnia parasitica CBS 223.65]|uniref:Dynein axonemal assembly factor 11-like CS domain-containing protein n=1 Tax=Saprolegnia parasitica (strain CBS 223.65) TaxID=695850 RepID=A0A067C846_SAPPC|nr:hypothetical protein SPRG_07667 [Saprolegnia parasitica CBS 223.65]KDO26954.1 hypothetical protein SPRG_07667 [Saprolegnia parasitica CBS 223.65]|eukprot:XP_012202335.1 hypothetical protein SPRG_07667 [Saprolegnia parasitica CBS 223.65]